MDSLIGQVLLFAGSHQPNGWMLCNGALLPIQQYRALFYVIGVRFGGDGQNSFALPNMKSPCDGVNYYIAVEGTMPPP